jgi:hypothetical protein
MSAVLVVASPVAVAGAVSPLVVEAPVAGSTAVFAPKTKSTLGFKS